MNVLHGSRILIKKILLQTTNKSRAFVFLIQEQQNAVFYECFTWIKNLYNYIHK